MKNYLSRLSIIFLIILIIGCNGHNKTVFPEFTFNEYSYLRFHLQNLKVPLNITVLHNSVFPFYQTKSNISFKRDTTQVFELKINHPVTTYLITSNSLAVCYAIPKDTLDIWINLENTDKIASGILFKGHAGSISTYLTKFKLNTTSVPRVNESIINYNHRVDSLTIKAQTVLNEYSKVNSLPEWFKKIENADIQYSGARDKISQFSQTYMWYNQFKSRPDNILDQINLKIDNPEAIFSESYYEFLCYLSPDKYDTLLTSKYRTHEIFYDYIKENLATAQTYLHSCIKDLFIAQRIGAFFSLKSLTESIISNDSSNFHKIDTLLNYARENVKDSAVMNILLNYYNDQIKVALESISLKAGSKAPDFNLTDLNGKNVCLSDFKGQIVFINFWATWCSPCINSIPDKNKLYKDFKNQELVLLNVCIDSDMMKWRNLIQNNDFQGTHLICTGKWISQIQNNYHINSIPHYTLIDRDGLVIINNASDIIEVENSLKKHIK